VAGPGFDLTGGGDLVKEGYKIIENVEG